jgi:hypothetical protein
MFSNLTPLMPTRRLTVRHPEVPKQDQLTSASLLHGEDDPARHAAAVAAAAAILRAHRRARGELVDDAPEPQTRSEVTATKIVAAYNQLRGGQ